MKHYGMARECAERLKPFDKTIKDATDFYIRHLNRRKSTGRPPGSGAYAGITRYMDWQQLRERMLKLSSHSQFDAKVLDRFETEMWGTRAKLAAKQRRATGINAKLIEQSKAKQAALTPEQYAQRICKRDGAANAAAGAFEQYLKQNPVPAGLEGEEHEREIKRQWQVAEKLLLPMTTPAGAFTDAMANDIYKALDKREVRGTDLSRLVKGYKQS